MRDYGKVQTSFWTSTTMRGLSEDGRMLALYLITSPHSTISGVFRLPDGYVCEDLQWDAERVAKGFSELFAKGFANRCESTKWVWVCAHLEWNPPENPNQRKSAAKVASAIPDECTWKPAFMRDCGPLLGLEPWSPPDTCETLSEGFANQEQEQEQKQEQQQEIAAAKPRRVSRPSKLELTFADYLAKCKAEGVMAVPADHPIRAYCQDAGITDEMRQIAWLVFRDRHMTGEKAKRQKDWPTTFSNSVKGRWYKLWFVNAQGAAEWTATGLQEKRVLDARHVASQAKLEDEHAPA